MSQLIVRNVEPELVQRLKRRAARHGRSAEAEHREILREALQGTRRRKPLKRHLLEMPDVGRDAEFERAPERARRVKL